MRVVREFEQKGCRVSVFSWNEKYLIKLEQGLIEQTFKISEMDLAGDEDIDLLLDDAFMDAALNRFKEMHLSLNKALQNT